MKHYYAVIIGSGQGGTPLAKKLAAKGFKTALVEKQYIGGTCINVGCTPTKTMIASANAIHAVRHSEKYGILTSGHAIDFNTVMERKNTVVESFREGSLKGLEQTDNLDLIFGEASFIAKKKLKVKLKHGGEQEITADKIFIDTGTRPSTLPIQGLHETGYYTSASIMELEQIPEHLLIIGGGHIGLEFGQMYRRFGSKVTILESNSRFLSQEDEDIADEIMNFMKDEGIDILTGAQAKKVSKSGIGISVSYTSGEEEKELSCTHILLAVGRTPNTDKLNLKAAGIETDDQGYIIAGNKLETSAADVFVIGDVKGGPEFTHIAYHDHIILYNNLVNGKDENINNRMVPYTMFTDPQLGRVGITEQEAISKKLNIKVAKLPMANVARAIEFGNTQGFIKAVVDAQSGLILGVAVIGREGGELMSVLQMAMAGGIKWQQLKDMIFAHPLYAESINNLFKGMD